MTGPALEEAVFAVLGTIIDPCSVAAGSPASLVDMGLVTGVEVTGDGVVSVLLRVTDGLCLMAAVFTGEARRHIAALEGVRSVHVALDSSHVWTPADMTEAYRARLAAGRASPAPA